MHVEKITTPSDSVFYFTTGCPVKSIRWVGATTAGHIVEIQTPTGDYLWGTEAAGANYVEESIMDRDWPSGFRVHTLDSGTLAVEIYTHATPILAGLADKRT